MVIEMDQNIQKPSIRFKGFTDTWEQYKLDVVVNRIATGLNPRDNFQLNAGGKNYYVTIKNFHHGELRLDDDCDKVDDSALALIQNRSDLQKDDILFSSIGRVGDCYLVDKTPNNWNINESVFTLRPNQKLVAPLYLFHTIHSDVVLSGILNSVTGSTFKSIKVNDLKKAQVPVPSIDEQLKIGEFISSIDNLITLHQRKYDKLVNTKMALLDKMFPKAGEVTPKLRFRGFTDAWEQYKLGELGQVVMNRRIFKDQTLVIGDIPFFKIGTFGDKPDAFISRELFEEYKSKYPYPNVGDILISASGSIGRIVEYTGKDEYFQDSNIVWLKHDNRLLNMFLKHFYSIVKWTGLEGSTIQRLYNKNILETEIQLPNTLEQKQIGTFLDSVDNLITLHQRKYEKLKNIKKALLQKMFV